MLSQRLGDMGDALINMSTGRFVLRAGDERSRPGHRRNPGMTR